ncbi:MAG: dihydropteroate synthase [Betaproteobacteria bacterium HGW-Betaproteobacteria-21]|nr:MAG: dihydropteroate synthase [Betaproteobacteria bacterium HGW-Betaproteobacteria-21]
MSILACGRFELDLSSPKIMAIVNLTTNSFSGDGLSGDQSAALRRAEEAVRAGAEILDIGAESTRPGSDPVPEQQEIDLLLPVLEELVRWQLPISVDTLKPATMRAVLAAGADMINDVNGFRAHGAIEAVAGTKAALCVMHMQGEPATMQADPRYDDVVAEVSDWLSGRAEAAMAAGVARERIRLDPGIGFGKTAAHNLVLTANLHRLVAAGFPVLYGASRKRTIQSIDPTATDPGDRLGGSLALALEAARGGASIIRVHDVRETVQALAVQAAVAEACD